MDENDSELSIRNTYECNGNNFLFKMQHLFITCKNHERFFSKFIIAHKKSKFYFPKNYIQHVAIRELIIFFIISFVLYSISRIYLYFFLCLNSIKHTESAFQFLHDYTVGQLESLQILLVWEQCARCHCKFSAVIDYVHRLLIDMWYHFDVTFNYFFSFYIVDFVT